MNDNMPDATSVGGGRSTQCPHSSGWGLSLEMVHSFIHSFYGGVSPAWEMVSIGPKTGPLEMPEQFGTWCNVQSARSASVHAKSNARGLPMRMQNPVSAAFQCACSSYCKTNAQSTQNLSTNSSWQQKSHLLGWHVNTMYYFNNSSMNYCPGNAYAHAYTRCVCMPKKTRRWLDNNVVV